MSHPALPDLQGWLPAVITQARDNPADATAQWWRLGGHSFREPFFEQALARAIRSPFHLLFRHELPLDSLLAWQAGQPDQIQPSGFIFHMSRCGSTLVSQMLAALPEHRVLSEPPALDTLLKMHQQGMDDERGIALLRAWVSAMSAGAEDGARRLFIKLDAWHILQFPLLRRAFPDTPWIFLHRQPVEVLASAIKKPGMHHVPGMIQFDQPGMDTATLLQMPPCEHMTAVLRTLLEAALSHLAEPGSKGIPVDYTCLPEAVSGTIATHFGLDLTPTEVEAMQPLTQFHAKQPSLYFEPDSEQKREEAGPEAAALCAERLDPLHQRLLALAADSPPTFIG